MKFSDIKILNKQIIGTPSATNTQSYIPTLAKIFYQKKILPLLRKKLLVFPTKLPKIRNRNKREYLDGSIVNEALNREISQVVSERQKRGRQTKTSQRKPVQRFENFIFIYFYCNIHLNIILVGLNVNWLASERKEDVRQKLLKHYAWKTNKQKDSKIK